MMKKLLCSLLFTVLTVGAINAQNIDVTGLGIVIPGDGSNTPAIPDDTQYGSVDVAAGSVSHTFTINNLTTDILILGLNNLSNQVDFSQSASPAPNVISTGGSSTFSVTFDPNSPGIKTSVVTVNVFNLTTTLSETYFFNIEGTGTAPGAEPIINVLGGATFITNGDTTPSTADATDYGDVDITTGSVTNTYTILNTGTADLTFPANVLFIGSSDFTVISQPTSPITPGNSSSFQITFDPSATGPISGTVLIQNNDTDENPFTFTIQGNGTDVVSEPEIDITGNGVSIADGDTTPSSTDDTDFGDVDIDAGPVVNTFTINNSGGADLTITGSVLVVGSADFTVTAQPSSPIGPSGSTTFSISYDPSATGSSSATVIVQSNDADENPYSFTITGNGIDPPSGFDQLMFTQYYEGTGSNKWIEIKNISSTPTVPGTYFIGLYLNTLGTIGGGIQTNTPISYQINFSIPAGGVVLFGNSAAASPAAGNRGSATTINDGTADNINTFTGNDILIISTSNDGNAYNNRIDILGEVSQTSTAIDWGTDTSLIKGCGTIEQPAIVYDPANIAYDENQFIELTLEEVNTANPNTNIALGTQTVGSTTWTSSWDNGIPDKTKNAIIAGTYSNSNGSFESCDLTVNGGAAINLNSGGTGSNYVLVDNNLTINGTFTIGDTESLITTREDATISGSITKIELTTPLNNFRDYTYWSSPVSTTIASAFTGVDPNRIWLWRTPSNGDTGNWEIASGAMQAGRGYLAEAPSTITAGQQHQVNFTGTPNNGVVNVPVGIDLTNGDGFGGYNIIGNPYPSAIDIDIFIEEQANPEIDADPSAVIDGTIWLWTHNTPIADNPGSDADYVAADYATYNLTGGVGTGTSAGGGLPVPTNIIGSGQGFLVQVFQVGNNAVTFENYMRLNDQNDTQFFKSKGTNKVDQEKDRIWLDMTSAEGAFNQILVGFFDRATDGFDKGYDGRFVSGGNTINFYSNLEDDIYAIQGLGTFDASKEVSLGFYASTAKTYTISISKIEGILKDEDVYLVDNELNIVHDLKQGDYQFEVLTAGNYQERFTLKFNSGVLSTDDFVLNNSFIVYNQNETLKIKSGVEIDELKVYDVTGRLLINYEPRSAAFDVPSQNIKAGTVLILNATMKDGSVISKKAIKY